MAIWHQFLSPICILYCAAVIHGILLDINDDEICNLLCKQCNGTSAVIANSQCECDFNDSDNEGVKCIQRLQKDVQNFDLNALSNDLTDEKRNMRSLKSKHLLETRDAERVAQYFINGGASTGHSHFVGVALSNAARDNNNSTTNSLLETARERPEATPTIPDPNIPGTKAEASMLEMEPVHYPVNRLYASSPVLYSMALPHRRHRYKLPNHALSRMVVGSPHIVRNLIAHRYFHHPIYRGLLNKNFYLLDDMFLGQVHNFNQTSDNSLTTGNNANKPIVANTPDAGADVLNQSTQYPVSSYQNTPHQSPLLNVLYSPLDEFIGRAVQHHAQRINSALSSVQNPNSYPTNDENTKRQNEALTAVTHQNTDTSCNDKIAEKTEEK
ncbi:uncharacterized protein LOC105183116 isoform X2 [Harpegnathos saltator]|uniref:uncharacterized protein LOC105183116 isoform X2 n=1 Tax=Harpegnathos saltator TaxID=610380 RepID=UPI00059087E9|nr:uncharacterized protein LOC105183116 isoform X2 [Harpegnathos saltator]